jgi:hypothetical protein
MESLNDRLRELGSAVAGISDRAAPADTLARARNAFVSGNAPSAPHGPSTRSRWVPALAAAACLALAGVTVGAGWRLSTPSQPAPISFSVGTSAAPGFVGDWVAAGADVPLPTRFSDGSELQLSPGARVRVTTTSATGADVLIERGSVHAAVAHPHGDGTAHWAVRAGPFEVRVTGTTFDAAWDPMAETFELTMIEGRVLVTGPGLPPDRVVVGGERLVVSVRDARMVLSSGRLVSMGPQAASVTMGPQAAPNPGPAEPAPINVEPQVAVVVAAAPAWKELATKGRYRDAFAAAEAAGFGAEVERAPAGDLLMLADAARFSGNPGRAREALLAARRRFGARGQSAFLLGKIAADQQGSPGDAVQWFETYLREEPGGPLAEQALGRILDLSRRASPEAGQRAAARYLARYPDGSYAALARSVVTMGGDPPYPPARPAP